MRGGLLIVVLFLFCKGQAQFLDTLHALFNQKTSIDARLESRFAFINSYATEVTGVRLGVSFQRKLRIGGGVSWLKSDVMVHQVNPYHPEQVDHQYLKFVYGCFYADFVFHKTKRWQLSVPIQAGLGKAWYQRQSDLKLWGDEQRHLLFFYEPGITVQFKVFRWLGAGADVCYRFALKDKKIGEHLSSPSGSIKLLVWFDQLFFVMFPDHKLTERFGPAYW